MCIVTALMATQKTIVMLVWRPDVLGEKGHREKTWNSELSYVKYMDKDPNITGN